MPRRTMSPEQLDLIADRFRVLGEPARLHILSALRHGERNVSDLVHRTGYTQANLSKHLQLLLRLGFVERRKDGVSAYYSLADPDVFRLCDLMCGRLEKELRLRRKVLAG
jgi:DNA-binding transcriptional ArsR family regulator